MNSLNLILDSERLDNDAREQESLTESESVTALKTAEFEESKTTEDTAIAETVDEELSELQSTESRDQSPELVRVEPSIGHSAMDSIPAMADSTPDDYSGVPQYITSDTVPESDDPDVDDPTVDLELSPADEATVGQVSESESSQLPDSVPSGTEADSFEQPELVGEILGPLPDTAVDESELDPVAETKVLKHGYQGGSILPSVSQSTLDSQQVDEVESTQRHSDRQVESQMKSDEDLAQGLARELGPEFESLRASQESVVRDYVASQQLLASILRVR